MLPDGMAPGLSETGVWSPAELEPPTSDDRINTSLTYGFVFDMCGVEVDPVTFQVRVDRYVSMHDAGTLLNPLIADGQVHGAFAQGVAAALYEEFVSDEAGSFLSGTFADYLVPTVSEIPELEILHQETASPFTPLGAKGMAEGNCMSTPACIANAVADALGVRDISLPTVAAPGARAAGGGGIGPSPRPSPRKRGEGEGGAMKPRRFDYVRPDSAEEAVAVLAEHGDAASVLAGGQSLMAMLNLRVAEPAVLVDIGRLAELDYIRIAGGMVEVGAAVTQNKLKDWPQLTATLPLVAAALPFVGHFQTRNKGTVCGSIAHADPSSELPLVLATLGGDVVLRSRRGTRVLPASAFQQGTLTTARAADELIVAVRFPVQATRRVAFREVARRHGDFAMIALAAVDRRRHEGADRRRRDGGPAGRARHHDQWRGGGARFFRHASGRSWKDMTISMLPRDAPRSVAPARPSRGGRGLAMRRVNKAERTRVSFTLNGRPVSGDAESRLLLTDFLRHVIGATGTHVGCEHGVCGCCTVLIDGVAVRGCLTLAVQAEGRAVTTVELLAAPDGTLNALQRAFQQHHALQCGFCTPGILMSFTDYLARNPHPTEDEIREILSGHLCRCTGYAGIVAAVLDASGRTADKNQPQPEAGADHEG